MEFAKSVADLIDHQGELAVGAIAEIDRQRVEGETEEARVAQQQHASPAQVEAVLLGAALRVMTQARPVARAMIGLVEAVNRRPVYPEQSGLPVRHLDPDGIRDLQITRDNLLSRVAHADQLTG